MAKILIKNGRVFDGERFSHSDVFVDGKQIVKLENNINDSADFVYDATGKIVSAGLVDAHVHMRGISSERFGTQAEMSCFPFGVTAAADGAASKGDKELLESFMLKAVVFAGASIKDNRAVFSNTERILSLYGDSVVGIKSYFDTNVGEIDDIKPLKEICEFAHKSGLRVMVHCTNSPVALKEILKALKPGDILTHAFNGSTNNAGADNFTSMIEAQKRGVVIDVGFAGNVHTDFGILKRALESGIVPNVISTDITRLSAYIRGGRYGMAMCMSIAKSLGMSEEDIFKAVTSNPANALGKTSEWGYLKVGGQADIAVFDYTDEGFDLTDKAGNRVKSDKGYRCLLTISDGQIVYKY